MKTHPPLILIAIDGADDRLIQTWVNEGYLPTIASVMERGCYGKVGGLESLAEHGTPLSLVSGVSRAVHGYYYFRQLVPKTYQLSPYNFSDTKVLPFWTHLSQEDKKVAVIDAPDSAMVANLKGIQVANWAAYRDRLSMDVLLPCTNPPELLEDVRQIFGKPITISEFNSQTSFAQDVIMYHRVLERIEKKGKLCRELCQRDDFDLISLGFYESHAGSHYFWKYLKAAPEEENQLTHAIRDIYQAIDTQIKLFLQELPQQANVVIYSAFGMADSYPTTGLIPDFCQKFGYQVLLTASEERSLKPLPLARKLLPQSWREAISQRLPLSVQERLINDNFANTTDWGKTRAFAIPSLYTSFIRVNLAGREPQGIVQPGKDYNDLLTEIETNLQQLIDPVTNKPAIKQIVKTAQWFNSEPPEHLPDIFVEWQPAQHFLASLIHPQTEITQAKSSYHRDSYHSQNGFMAVAGDAIKTQGQFEDISILDLAPTFLNLMKVEIPPELTGNVVKFT
ncbi:MAG: hypothetical protein F6K45_22535 [Kamptonema sp. SIO1D9]|nr:hypothetical protein [Kamptonema sp. SIO1D9]